MHEKHTQGPWIAASKASSVVGLPVVAQSGRSIASVSFFNLGEKFSNHERESLANSRLIAAAPDMLQALDDARFFIQDCLDNCHDRGTIGNLMGARDVIDAAIRKATEPAPAAPEVPFAIDWRCDVTGNLSGTDTRMIGAPPCQCQGCRAAARIEQLTREKGEVETDRDAFCDLYRQATHMRETAEAERDAANARAEAATTALRDIAEGNLGDSPWQANYARIRAVARAALATDQGGTVGQPPAQDVREGGES